MSRPEPTQAEYEYYANKILAWRARQRIKDFLYRHRRVIAGLAIGFLLAWFFRYEPVQGGQVYDRWTHQYCVFVYGSRVCH